MTVFEQVFAFVLGHEGGYTDNRTDPGNWTGGRCGVGECRGTHWGISAATYPCLDIRALTEAQVREIYRRDYWDRAGCGGLPPPLALVVFDAAINNGVPRAELGCWCAPRASSRRCSRLTPGQEPGAAGQENGRDAQP